MICACPCKKKFKPTRPNQIYRTPECRERARAERSRLTRVTLDELRLIEGVREGRKGMVPTRYHPFPGHSPTGRQKGRQGPLSNALMTSEQVRQFLGVSKWQMRAWRTSPEGGGPAFIRIGRRARYLPSDVTQFVQERRSRRSARRT